MISATDRRRLRILRNIDTEKRNWTIFTAKVHGVGNRYTNSVADLAERFAISSQRCSQIIDKMFREYSAAAEIIDRKWARRHWLPLVVVESTPESLYHEDETLHPLRYRSPRLT